MNTSSAYDRYLLKIEKNSINDNISTDKQRFVEIYNEYQIRYCEYIYNSGSKDDLRYIENLLILEKLISESIKNRETYSFELPKNYFNLSSVYALGSKGNCSNKRIDLPIEISDLNKSVYMIDDNTKPSFEYRESLYTVGNGNINVFYTDFEINKIFLSYYRYPKKIKLLNPDNPESNFDDSFELEFDDKTINKILTATASGFDINDNSERWQLNNIFSKKDL